VRIFAETNKQHKAMQTKDFPCFKEVSNEKRRALIFRKKYAADNHYTYHIVGLSLGPFGGWVVNEGMKTTAQMHSLESATSEAIKMVIA